MKHFNSLSFGRRMLLAVATTVVLTTGSAWSQVTYTVSWGVYDSTGTTPVSGASATADLVIGSGVDASNSTQSYSSSTMPPSWLQSFTMTVSIGGTLYNPVLGDLASLTWRNASANPNVNPDVFKFTGSDGSLPNPFSISEVTGQDLQIRLTDTSSNTSYILQQSGSFSAVPEPEEWAAIASGGLLAFGIWHRRSRKAKKA
jgi:hypothetical protein